MTLTTSLLLLSRSGLPNAVGLPIVQEPSRLSRSDAEEGNLAGGQPAREKLNGRVWVRTTTNIPLTFGANALSAVSFQDLELVFGRSQDHEKNDGTSDGTRKAKQGQKRLSATNLLKRENPHG
jgi:hypothetical protein